MTNLWPCHSVCLWRPHVSVVSAHIWPHWLPCLSRSERVRKSRRKDRGKLGVCGLTVAAPLPYFPINSIQPPQNPYQIKKRTLSRQISRQRDTRQENGIRRHKMPFKRKEKKLYTLPNGNILHGLLNGSHSMGHYVTTSDAK